MGLLGRSIDDDDEVSGDPGEVCRYNQVDATRGGFLSVDYAVALRQLGGNISLNRFQATYRHYYKVSALQRYRAGGQHDTWPRELVQSTRP